MTGTIFPDLASVATGKDRPFARAAFVQYLAKTCEQPLEANKGCGRSGVAPPVNCSPRKPTTTLHNASSTCRNQTCVNLSPSSLA